MSRYRLNQSEKISGASLLKIAKSCGHGEPSLSEALCDAKSKPEHTEKTQKI
jgi:hypothetical protein